MPFMSHPQLPSEPTAAMTRFRLWREAMDAVLKRRGQPSLTFEQAWAWFDREGDPAVLGETVLPDAKRAPWDDRYFEERLTRETGQ